MEAVVCALEVQRGRLKSLFGASGSNRNSDKMDPHMLSEHMSIHFPSKTLKFILFARIIVSSGLTSPRLKRHLLKKQDSENRMRAKSTFLKQSASEDEAWRVKTFEAKRAGRLVVEIDD